MKLILKIVVVVLMIPLAIGLGFVWRRYCPSVSGVTVSVNGVKTEASVNRCPNQLIRVSVPGEVTILVDRENKEASVPNASAFWEGFGMVLSHDLNPLGVSLNNRIKIERDTNLLFFENGLSYKDFTSGDEIVINFNDGQSVTD